MGRQQEVRDKAQAELENLAHENTKVDQIDHHTQDEADEKIGLTWTNLSHIYFQDEENIGSVQDLKDALETQGYLAIIEEENGEACLNVQSTKDLFDRFVDE